MLYFTTVETTVYVDVQPSCRILHRGGKCGTQVPWSRSFGSARPVKLRVNTATQSEAKLDFGPFAQAWPTC